MIVRGVGVLCATIAVRRVGGWSGLLLRTLLGYGFGSFTFVAGTATCSGYGASRLGPLLQGALAAGVAAGRLYGGRIDVPVLIQNVVSREKLDKLTGGCTRGPRDTEGWHISMGSDTLACH